MEILWESLTSFMYQEIGDTYRNINEIDQLDEILLCRILFYLNIVSFLPDQQIKIPHCLLPSVTLLTGFVQKTHGRKRDLVYWWTKIWHVSPSSYIC